MSLSKGTGLNPGKTWSVFILVLWLAGMPAACAFKLVPITMEFEPSVRGASKAFRVENESEEQVAVQISMLTRSMNLEGKEENALAEKDFIVYPAQILLKPKRTQVVRVQWIGEARPEKELAYRRNISGQYCINRDHRLLKAPTFTNRENLANTASRLRLICWKFSWFSRRDSKTRRIFKTPE